FDAHTLGESYRAMMEEAGVCEKTAEGRWRSLVRFSSLGDMLLVHSGFPTEAPDAVFFGPDTYRFCRALQWIAGQDRGFSPAGVLTVMAAAIGAATWRCASSIRHYHG